MPGLTHVVGGRWVYFAQEDRYGPIKIGKSNNPWARVHEGNTWNPRDLWILAASEELDEREIDEMFDHLRIRGEWFRAEPELLDFILEIAGNQQQARAS